MARLLIALSVVAFATCASAQRDAPGTPADTDLISSSELFYGESGGFAGRVHTARIEATGGAIVVEYRPAEARYSDPVQRGTMPPGVYLPLWRAVERLQPWTRESRKPPPGSADMIGHDLRIRIGSRSKTLTWTEDAPMGDAAAVGAQILAAARDYTLNR